MKRRKRPDTKTVKAVTELMITACKVMGLRPPVTVTVK